jgi:hypothetical protein
MFIDVLCSPLRDMIVSDRTLYRATSERWGIIVLPNSVLNNILFQD